MTERPILFSAEMVRAILDGRKTQTRRIIKPQPPARAADAGCLRTSGADDGLWSWLDSKDLLEAGIVGDFFRCPYGVEGDRLWVREAFQPLFADGVSRKDADWETGKGYAIRYVATEGRTEWMDADDGITDRCMPGIHMPRWASRITLEIRNIRVERVQEISEEDALAEGCSVQPVTQEDLDNLMISDASPQLKAMGKALGVGQFTAKNDFVSLWDALNVKRDGGIYAWSKNPWVWPVEFSRVTQ